MTRKLLLLSVLLVALSGCSKKTEYSHIIDKAANGKECRSLCKNPSEKKLDPSVRLMKSSQCKEECTKKFD